MAHYPPDSIVMVRPFAHQQDGSTVTIGDLARQVFLAIPTEGLDLLKALAEGKTVGEAVALYEQKHAETPDVEDFLTVLADEGFLGPADESAATPFQRTGEGDGAEASAVLPRSNLAWITPTLARRIFGPSALTVAGLLSGLALALIANDPSVVPGPTVLLFPRHLAALSLALFAFTLAGVMVHEVGHLVAARAAGVPARIGLNHRLWVVVAETDMTGIWLAPRRRRYLAFLAGPIIDAVSASLLVGLLWAGRQGWIDLSPMLAQLTAAALLTYLARLLWQCFLFVRTDFYYVLATAWNCKNLLADTEEFLRNFIARLRGKLPAADQSAIPAAEMRVIRAYSLVWLAGRAVALGSLVLLTLPVLGRYLTETARVLTGGRSRYGIVDILTIAVLGLGFEGAGLYMWIRSLYRARVRRRTDGLAV
jgi:hypothetical protein